MDFKQNQRREARNINSKASSETAEEGVRFFQPGASGVWGKYNGQLLMCKLSRLIWFCIVYEALQ